MTTRYTRESTLRHATNVPLRRFESVKYRWFSHDCNSCNAALQTDCLKVQFTGNHWRVNTNTDILLHRRQTIANWVASSRLALCSLHTVACESTIVFISASISILLDGAMIGLCVRPSVRPSIRSSIYSSVIPSICLSYRPSLCLSVLLSHQNVHASEISAA